ncbi:hypothetical protein O0L34_g14656 [Tuta absoluta]|nr:hypothetical protein O0L34_g14656 [Tuta absoluta]
MSSPKIWSRFVRQRKSDGAVYKFIVQEGTAGDKEAVCDFWNKYMTPNETFYKAAGIPKNEEALKEMRVTCTVEEYYDVSHCMICYEDKVLNTARPIVAISFVSKEDWQQDEFIVKTTNPALKKLYKLLSVTADLYRVKEKLDVEKYYCGWGLCVRPDYAGLGIAREMFSLRRELCKAHGVPATGAWMTSIGSQKAAERAGWKTVFEIPTEELGRLSGCDFVDAPTTCKVMVAYAED